MPRPTKKQKTRREPPESQEDEPNSLVEELPNFTVVTQPIVASKAGATTKSKSKSKSKSKASQVQVDEHFETFQSGFDPSLNVHYMIKLDGQVGQWEKIGKRYKAFQTESSNLADAANKTHRIEKGECVAIRGLGPEDGKVPDEDLEYDWWYAEVIEIRAENPQHVYLLIAWIYRPHDLKDGRQEYHAENEVFPSNHLQVIAATTAESKVVVRKWEKGNQIAIDQEQYQVEEDDETFLVWRQAVNTLGGKQSFLTKLDLGCICMKPANPDERLVQCNHCKRWIHKGCIERQAMVDFRAGKISTVKFEATNGDLPSTKSETDDTMNTVAPPAQHPGFLSRIMSPFKKPTAESSAESKTEEDTLASPDVPIETTETATAPTPSSKRKRNPNNYSSGLMTQSKKGTKAKHKEEEVETCANVKPDADTAYIAKLKPASKGAASIEIYEDTEDGALTATTPLKCLFADCKKAVSWKNEDSA